MSKRAIRCPRCHNEIEIYQNPIPTVDIIIEVKPKGIVLIKRKNPPYGWAIPGGFVDYGESLEGAAMRETREETSLEVTSLKQFHAYSDPRRDPRHHSISTVFVAKAAGTPVAKDDAIEMQNSTTLTEEAISKRNAELAEAFKAEINRTGAAHQP